MAAPEERALPRNIERDLKAVAAMVRIYCGDQHGSAGGALCAACASLLCQQPVVEPQLHSAGAASRLAALLLPQILPVFSVVAPCQPGASPASVRR